MFFSYNKTVFSSPFYAHVRSGGSDNFGQLGIGSSSVLDPDRGVYTSIVSAGKNNYGQLGDGSTSTT